MWQMAVFEWILLFFFKFCTFEKMSKNQLLAKKQVTLAFMVLFGLFHLLKLGQAQKSFMQIYWCIKHNQYRKDLGHADDDRKHPSATSHTTVSFFPFCLSLPSRFFLSPLTSPQFSDHSLAYWLQVSLSLSQPPLPAHPKPEALHETHARQHCAHVALVF